jgi:hypothetical protein
MASRNHGAAGPGVVLASLLWAVWHVGIQGTDFLPVDLASAVVNQGVQGLSLGYLWSRYRMMWPILVVHGAINGASIVIALLQPEPIVPGGSIGPNDSHARPLIAADRCARADERARRLADSAQPSAAVAATAACGR